MSTTNGILSSQDISLFSQQGVLSTAVKNSATPEFSEVFEQASAADGSVTNVNLDDATEGQILIASQTQRHIARSLQRMRSDFLPSRGMAQKGE